MSLPRPVAVSGALLGGALVAWIVTYQRIHGMDAGPGTDLGGLGWYLGVWVTMMAAMMLPSVAPMVLVFNRVNRERPRRDSADAAPTWVFVAGYLLAWTVYGLVAYGSIAPRRTLRPASSAGAEAGATWPAGHSSSPGSTSWRPSRRSACVIVAGRFISSWAGGATVRPGLCAWDSSTASIASAAAGG